MAEDSGIPPLKNNSKIPPEPHKPMRKATYVEGISELPVFVQVIEGDYRVTYWPPFHWTKDEKGMWLHLVNSVATWEKYNGKASV